jgi:transcriptional regulator with XRE-family HTH domain
LLVYLLHGILASVKRQIVRLRAGAVGELRARRHMTQSELARIVGVDFRYFSRLVNGAAVGTRVRRRMCERLGLDFDDLFEMVEPAEAIA